MNPPDTDQDRKYSYPWRILFILVPILGVICIAMLAFYQGSRDLSDPEFIPVELHSGLEADYMANPNPTRVPGVRLDIIWDVILDREPRVTDLEERQTTLQNSLLTPVPTVTPALLACEGIHFVYADQDTWIDSANPTATHGSEPQLQLGRDRSDLKRLLLHFPIDDVIPANTLIHSARLEMDVEDMVGITSPESVVFFNLLYPFGEVNTNWSNQPELNRQYQAVELASGSIHVWDVTNVVRDWLSVQSINEGLVIEPQSPTDFNVVYYSREIINEDNQRPNSRAVPVGPRLIINCGGTLPQAVAVNLITPTPTATPLESISPTEEATEPPATSTTLPTPTAPLPTPTAPRPSPTIPLPTPTLPAPSPTPTELPPAPSPTPTPLPPPDDGGDDGGGGDPPPPPPPSANLALSMTDSVDPVIAGNNLKYFLSITNNGPNTATGVTLSDTLPAGVTLVSVTVSQGAGCSGTSTITCNLGTIASGNSVTVTIIVTVNPSAIGMLFNPASVFANETDPNTSDNMVIEITTISNAADLAITKSDSSDPAAAGSNLTYTLNVTNNGPSDATSVTITDTLPVSATFSSASASCLPSGGTVICSLGNLAAGSNNQVTITVTLSPTLINGTIINNSAIVAGNEADPIPGNNTATEPTTIDNVADLAIRKIDSPDPVVAGALLTYTLTITNNGPSDATGVTITDTLPAGVSFVSASGGCLDAGGIVTCSVPGTLLAGSSVQRVIIVTVGAGVSGLLTNQAAVGGSEADTTPGNNTTSITTAVIGEADLAISKADNPDPVMAGETLTYTLSITNNGPSDATGVVITDTLPGGVSFASATGGCTEAGGIVTCNIGGLTVGSSVQRIIVVTVNAATLGPLTNIATVGGSETDPVVGNNTASITTTVTSEADLAISKNDNPDPVTAGETLTYTLSITNNGPSDATGVVITDTLPGGVTFASTTGGCTEAGGIVTCNIGGLIVGSSVQRIIVVTVNAATIGTLTNTGTVGGNGTDPVAGNNTDSITTTVNTGTDLEITKVDNPTLLAAGEILTYTLSITNNGPSDAVGVVVTDTLPLSVTLLGSNPIPTTQSGQELSWSLATLAAGASQTIIISVRVDSAFSGVLANTAIVTSTTFDPGPGPNSATELTLVTTDADLTISKSDNPDPVTAGMTLTYTLSITNNGPSDATGVVVTDTLPGGVVFASATGCTEAGGIVTCNIGGLTAGSSVQRTVVVTVSPAITGTLTNVGTVGGNETDSVVGNNTDTIVTTINTGADLTISKSDNPDPVMAGETLTYTLSITNNGPSDATGVVITDTLPGGVTFASATEGCTEAGGIVTCNIGGLTVGSSVQRIIVVTVNAATTGPLTNIATVGGSETDPVVGNNTDSITTTVTTEADLAISKSDNPDPVLAGTTLTYTLSITNNGPSDATGLTITDTLPVSVTFASATGGCTGSGGIVTCTVASLAAGGSLQRTIVVTISSAATSGTLTNSAEVTSTTTDPTPGNNTTSITTTVNTAADLSVSKTVDNASPFVGDTITFTITIDNAGPSDATNVELSDPLPAGLSYVSDSTTQGSYNSGTGLWTVGTITSTETVTLTLVTTVTSAGTITQTAQITASDQLDPDSTPGNSIEVEDDQESKDITAIPLPALFINDVTVTEGDSGTITATFTVSMSKVISLTVTVNYATSDNTATTAGSDYIAASGPLSFPPGTTVQTFTVQIQGDTVDETDETYTVTLSSPANATIADGTGTGSIIDDDNPSLSINDVSVTEGDSGSVTAVFTVTLSAVGVQAATVDFATVNNTANAPGDYTATSGTLNFPPGITQQTLTVTVIGDVVIEGNETFFVNLSNPGNATISDGQGVGTIIDDDGPAPLCSSPVVTLTTTADSYVAISLPNSNFGAAAVLNSQPPFVHQHPLIKFDLSSIPPNSIITCAAFLLRQTSVPTNTGQTINVHQVTADWTELNVTWNNRTTATPWATPGGDFDPTIVASFVPSTTNHVVNITSLAQTWYSNPGANFGLILDPVDTGNNSVVTFASRENGGNPPPRLVVEYIPGLLINDVTVAEGNSGTTTAVFSVTLSFSSAQTVTVDYDTADNTATTVDSDYNSASGTLTFSPGTTAQAITITINGDLNHEANETFLVNLSNPSNAGIVDGQGVGTITNDEAGGMLIGPGSNQLFLPIIIKSASAVSAPPPLGSSSSSSVKRPKRPVPPPSLTTR